MSTKKSRRRRLTTKKSRRRKRVSERGENVEYDEEEQAEKAVCFTCRILILLSTSVTKMFPIVSNFFPISYQCALRVAYSGGEGVCSTTHILRRGMCAVLLVTYCG